MTPTGQRRAFSVTEMLVVIGVIVLLLGLLFPALGAFRRSGQMTKSMANLRQIGAWIRMYADDNRDHIVPSQFDYRGNSYPGKVRSVVTPALAGLAPAHTGTWADILWSEYYQGVSPEAGNDPNDDPPGIGNDFRYDSPDGLFYGQRISPSVNNRNFGEDFENPFRSVVENTRNATGSPRDIATPFGAGAGEAGKPGYFAANNFFNSDPDAQDCLGVYSDAPDAGWWTHSQIRMPERSMYLVDSFAGETIQPWPQRFKLRDKETGDPQCDDDPSIEIQNRVDFRYSGSCLMLFLDGRIEPQTEWDTICDLEGPGGRGIRIRQLDRRSPDL